MSDDSSSAVDEQKVIREGDNRTAPLSKEETEQIQALQEYHHERPPGELSMRVKVYSPFRDYYDGLAFSLSAENATGTFDVLPKHHSFMSLLSPCDLIVRTVEDGEQRIRISGGLLHVKADSVVVFLDV
jgi:hypothetical protein